MNIKEVLKHAKAYFNLLPHKEDEQDIVAQVNSDITFRGGKLWVLMFAILIASLGLNVNSTAVIIGAMLISPLMGPIIGMGFALGTNDIDMLKRAVKNYAVATLISILTATFYWLVTPIDDAQSELLARTSPTLYDVLIAFCGGAAGIIAMCTKGKGNVIPGVAIATALMPPLCTAGFGLGTGNLHYFLGAFYLFFINTVFIALATLAGVRIMHFEKKVFISEERSRKVRHIITTIVIITLVPAAIMTASIVQQSIFERNVSHFVKAELSQNGTQLLSTDVDDESKTLRVVAVGREINERNIADAESHMSHYGLEKYRLAVIQGAQSDSLLTLNSRLNQLSATREADHQKMLELSQQNNELQSQLDEYTRYETLGGEISREAKALFPTVTNISLARMAKQQEEGAHFVVAVVETPAGSVFGEVQRLRQWLKARTEADSVAVFITKKK